MPATAKPVKPYLKLRVLRSGDGFVTYELTLQRWRLSWWLECITVARETGASLWNPFTWLLVAWFALFAEMD